jgi:excisionase family DNA binding protein
MALLMSISEAADYIGITVSTLCQYVDAGAIPYYDIAGKKMFKRADLYEFIETCRVTPARGNIAQMPARKET